MCVGGGSRAQSHTLKLPHAARLSRAIDGHRKSEGSFFQSRSLPLPVGQSISQTTGQTCNYLSTLSRTEQPCRYGKWAISSQVMIVTVPSVTLARKVGPGLQDLQTRARRILAERNAEKAEENTWIGRMVVAESIGELDGLIKSRAT